MPLVVGLAIACIGLDPMTAGMRFTFDSYYLMGGVSFVPVLVGFFAFSLAMLGMEDNRLEMGRGEDRKVKVKIDRILLSWLDFRRVLPTYIRSSVIGTVIGITLGPMVETNLRRALVMSDGDFSVFLTRPICATFLVIAVLTLLLPVAGPGFGAWRRAREAMSADGSASSAAD